MCVCQCVCEKVWVWDCTWIMFTLQFCASLISRWICSLMEVTVIFMKRITPWSWHTVPWLMKKEQEHLKNHVLMPSLLLSPLLVLCHLGDDHMSVHIVCFFVRRPPWLAHQTLLWASCSACLWSAAWLCWASSRSSPGSCAPYICRPRPASRVRLWAWPVAQSSARSSHRCHRPAPSSRRSPWRQRRWKTRWTPWVSWRRRWR